MAESSTWSCYEEIKLFGELLIENTLVQPTRLNQKNYYANIILSFMVYL